MTPTYDLTTSWLPIIYTVAFAAILFGTIACAFLAWWLFTPAPPADQPNVDTLWRGKRCGNCQRGAIAIRYPLIGCDHTGREKQPEDVCADWK